MTMPNGESVIMKKLFKNHDLTRRILSLLSYRDLYNCSLVSKSFYLAVQDLISSRRVEVTVELIKDLKKKNLSLKNYLQNNFNKYALDVDIRSWSKGTPIESSIYDKLIKNSKQLSIKSLTLRACGAWSTCHCPNEKSVKGEQIGQIQPEETTSLEYLHIASTFQISACALLDLISKSPKLRVLKFHGILLNLEHVENFETKHFLSNIEHLYWPWSIRKHARALNIIANRNENIVTFYSSSKTICDLLAADALPNLQFLSIILNEDWTRKIKKAYNYVEKIKYLGTAKKLIGLEIRTFELRGEDENEEDEKANQIIQAKNVKIERLFEQYKTSFWEQVGKLQNLKYLAIFGSWELEEVCREICRQSLTVEYLSIHLLPTSVITAIEEPSDSGESIFVLSMGEGIKSLRKLINLRSIHYACYEKVHYIDEKTTSVLRELTDLIWSLDFKSPFTQQMEDFLVTLHRRGNQLGRSYKLLIHVLPQNEMDNSEFVIEQNLRSLNSNIMEKLDRAAQVASYQRYGVSHKSFHIWGIEQDGNSRDGEAHEKIKAGWQYYQDKFNQSVISLR